VLSGDKTDAYAMTDIRVGLESLYKNKDIITVYNSRISIGFATDKSYKESAVLYSSSGFTFETDSTAYLAGKTEYSSYDEVRAGLNGLDKTKNFACLTGPGKWKIYSVSSSGTSSKNLMKVTSDKGVFLIDSAQNAQKAGYSPFPQIKAVNSKKDSKKGLISLGSRSYRGRIEIGRYDKGLIAVNIVNIEAYLCGVVTCEMSKSYPLEALRAQAVCARSYAYAKAGFGCKGTLSNAYNLVDNTYSQVYKGALAETGESVKAVTDTVGEIILSDDKPVEAFYFSTSGGSTEAGIEVWGIKSSIYTGVFDEYELFPEKSPWVVSYSLNQVEELLKSKGINIGTVEKVKAQVVTSSGRVHSLKITGSKDSKVLGLNEAESIFDLPSSKYIVVMGGNKDINVIAKGKEGDIMLDIDGAYAISDSGTKKIENLDQAILISDSNFTNIPLKNVSQGSVSFFGMGYGHGIGLSQSGARGLAQKGKTYKEIIDYYYSNVSIGVYNEK